MVWLQVKSANYSAACETELWLPGNHQASEGLAWCKSPPVLSSKVSAMHPFFQHCYMKVCDACTIKNFIMICRYCCKSSTFQSRLASLHRFALLMTPTSCFFPSFWSALKFHLTLLYPFLIAAIVAGVGSAAAVLLLAVVIVITVVLLKIKYTGKHVMGCVSTIKPIPLF